MAEKPTIVEVEKVNKPILKSCLKKTKKSTITAEASLAQNVKYDKVSRCRQIEKCATNDKNILLQSKTYLNEKLYDPCEICFPKRLIIETFDMKKIIKEKEVIHDEEEIYLKLRRSINLIDNEELHPEIVSKLQLCVDMFHVCIYHNILFGQRQCRVRLASEQSEVELKTKLARAELSPPMTTYLTYLSDQCLELLEDVGILCDYIELDGSKKASILNEDREVRVEAGINILSLSDCQVPWHEDENVTEESDSDNNEDYAYLKVSSQSLVSNIKSSGQKRNIKIQPLAKEKRDIDQTTSAVQIIFSLRNSVPAREVFRQYLVSMIDPDTNTYILLCQVGPLVQESRLVLYQYNCNDEIKTLTKSLSNYSNIPLQHQLQEKLAETAWNNFTDQIAFSESIVPFEPLISNNGCMVINDFLIRSELENFEKQPEIKDISDKNTELTCDKKVLIGQAIIEVEDSDNEADIKDSKDGDNAEKSQKHKLQPQKNTNKDKLLDESNKLLQRNAAVTSGDDIKPCGTEQQNKHGKTTHPTKGEIIYHNFTMKQVLECWEQNEGKLVYQLTDLKDCIKHSIHTIRRQ